MVLVVVIVVDFVGDRQILLSNGKTQITTPRLQSTILHVARACCKTDNDIDYGLFPMINIFFDDESSRIIPMIKITSDDQFRFSRLLPKINSDDQDYPDAQSRFFFDDTSRAISLHRDSEP